MKNKELDIDIVRYSEIIFEALKNKDISMLVELHPQYTLLLNKLPYLGIRDYCGIEPDYPERTRQAIRYYRAFNLDGIRAAVINSSIYDYLGTGERISKDAVFASFQLDRKTGNLEKLAEALYQRTAENGLNIHVGLEDDSAFINAGFKKENRFYVK